MTQLLCKAIHIHAAVLPFHGGTAVVFTTTVVGHPVGIDLSTGRDSLIGFGGNY